MASEFGRDPGAGVDWYPDHNDYDEMRVFEIIARIGHKVGVREARNTDIRKDTLNSVHAYLTGAFFVNPEVLGSQQSPDKDRFRIGVAHVADISTSQPDKGSFAGSTPLGRRPFRRGELVQLAEALDASEDQRGWTPGGK